MVYRRRIARFLWAHLIWVIVVAVALAFEVAAPAFLTWNNFVNILLHASVLGVLTIGETIVLLTGNFDLSAEGTLSLVTVVAAWLMLPYRSMAVAQAGGVGWEISPLVVIPFMLVLGALVGLANGIMVTRLRMSNFIVTLAMQLVLRGLAFVISAGAVMAGTPVIFNWLGASRLGPLPVAVLAMIVLFVIAWIFLERTSFGRVIYAVGGNPDAAVASGFDGARTVTAAYMISGLLAAVAGWMLLGRLGAANPTLGQGMTLEMVAAAVIGGVALSGGIGSIGGAFAGVLLLSIIADGMNLVNVNPYWVEGVQGAIILVALALEAQRVRVVVGMAREERLSGA